MGSVVFHQTSLRQFLFSYEVLAQDGKLFSCKGQTVKTSGFEGSHDSVPTTQVALAIQNSHRQHINKCTWLYWKKKTFWT